MEGTDDGWHSGGPIKRLRLLAANFLIPQSAGQKGGWLKASRLLNMSPICITLRRRMTKKTTSGRTGTPMNNKRGCDGKNLWHFTNNKLHQFHAR